MKAFKGLIWGFFFSIFLWVLIFLLVSCNGYDWTNQESVSDFDKICIAGHVYYKQTIRNSGYLSIKLTDEGKPVLCKKNQKQLGY